MLEIKFKCSECNTEQTEYFGDFFDNHLAFDLTGGADSTTIECECENCFHQNEIAIMLEPLESYKIER